MLSSRLEDSNTLKCCFKKITLTTYVRFVGKIQDQSFNVWLFSNSGNKVQKRGQTTGHICSLWLEDNNALNFGPVFYQQPWHMWLHRKIAIKTYLFTDVLQSKGQDSNSQWNFMKQEYQTDIRIVSVGECYSFLF